MQSVTSNAVANEFNRLSYSTSEKFTGRYWVDGKPIYCNVIRETFSLGISSVKTMNVSGLNIDYPIKINFIYQDGENVIPMSLLSGDYLKVRYNQNGIYIETSSSWALGNGLQTVIIEYTKTTD